jgi:hypothetical protein
MTERELRLFESFVRCSDRYLEFGSGGSTCFVANIVTESVISVDSSKEWQDKVASWCHMKKTRIVPELFYADIGPLGDWGYPTDASTAERWPAYHGGIWTNSGASNADLYLIDGRFRIACFMQVVLHCEIGSTILLHDFASRPQYHVVKEVAREIATVEDLSVFQPLRERIRATAIDILADHKLRLE